MESLPAPPVPGSAAPDGLQVRVEAEAFALLREGKNPTVARVRERMGGGSPNAVTPALQRWRLTFAAQLQANAGAALDKLPPGVLEIVQALWSRALFEAHRVRSEARSTSDALEQLSTAIAELNERLAAVREREATLDAERRELAIERRRLTELESRAARERSRRRETSPKKAARKPSARRPAERDRARRRHPKHRR